MSDSEASFGLPQDAIIGIVVGGIIAALIILVIVGTLFFFWALHRWGSGGDVFSDQRARRRQLSQNVGGRSMLFDDKNRVPIVKVSRRPSTKTFMNSRRSSASAKSEGRLYSNTTADPERIVMQSAEGALNPLFASRMELQTHALSTGESFYHSQLAHKPIIHSRRQESSDSDDSLNPYD